MTDEEIVDTYSLIRDYYNKFLKGENVRLPNLKVGANYTKDALTLIYLAKGYPNTKTVS